MSTKHTQGTLTAVKSGPRMADHYSQSWAVVIDGKMQIVAGCFSDIGGDEAAEANARRLALAWNCHDELVESLDRFLGALQRNNVPTPSYMRRAELDARAVLAKVKEQQP